jgi:hypothetical protein
MGPLLRSLHTADSGQPILLREAAGGVRHALTIDRSFIMTTLDDPNTMPRLGLSIDACLLLRVHR